MAAKISLHSHGCQSARLPGSFITVSAAGMPCGWWQESYAKGSLGLFSCPLNPTSGKLLCFLLWLRSLASTNGIKMPFCPPLRAFLCLPSKAGTTADTGATPADVYEMEKIPSPSLCHCLLHCSHGGVSPYTQNFMATMGENVPLKVYLQVFFPQDLGTSPWGLSWVKSLRENIGWSSILFLSPVQMQFQASLPGFWQHSLDWLISQETPQVCSVLSTPSIIGLGFSRLVSILGWK